MKRSLLSAWLVLPAVAGAQMYDGEYQACNQSTTVDIVQCVRDAGSKWDAQLKPAYEALVERSEQSQLPSLETAQRLWTEYRQANCAFYAESGGTLGQIEAMECYRAMTKARVCELQQANVGEALPPGECQSGSPSSTHTSPSQPAAAGTRSSGTVPAAPSGKPPSGHAPTAPPGISGKSQLESLRYATGGSFLLMQNRSSRPKTKTKTKVETKAEGSLHAYVMFEKDLLPSGGSAVFGWIEGLDRVVLLSHSKYLPSLTRAATTRTLTFEKMLTELDQAPRYTLTCVWEQEGDRIAPPLRVYGERDDANSAAKQDPSLLSLRVTWIHVPASRAERAFADRDYCAEIATTEKSPVPLWEEVVGVGK